jgi:D-aminopeptidase
MPDAPRLADLGIRIGALPTGPTNSVLDVPGVGLGHATVVRDDPEPPAGGGVARTGVTVLDPGGDLWARPVPAGVAVLNGAGELTGRSQVEEWGIVETPVFLTSTMQVGRVYDAACRLLMAEQPAIGVDDVVIPVVGECDDSWLSDPRTGRITDQEVAAAWAEARATAGAAGPPGHGAVGAGAGMTCLGWKGGIGTSSRILPDGHTVAVVLLCNFGQWDRLTVGGVAVGRALGRPDHMPPPPAGSCLGVVVTDAPLDAAACARLARRVGLGLARVGSTAHHASGELFLALATGLRAARGAAPERAPLPGGALNPYFEAVVDAAEESVLSCLLAAEDTTGRAGRSVAALPIDRVRAMLRAPGPV